MSRTRKRHSKKISMPERPRQHEIETEAVRYITNKLPNNWTCQELTRDYGIDLLVEIFENGVATGLQFEIQSKGHERFTIRVGNKVAQSIKVSTLNYFESLVLPVLLIVYSAEEKCACYLWIKPYITEVLDKESLDWRTLDSDSEITLHLPLPNVFDERVKQHIQTQVEIERARSFVKGGENSIYFAQHTPAFQGFATSTRLLRPKITSYLHRERLIDKLSNTLAEKSVFIQADAGYGKTWLLQDFINSTNPSVSIWYTFTKDHLDALRFIEELASELARQTSKIGPRTLLLIQERGSETRPDEAFAVLVNEVSTEGTIPILLILEDIHNIEDDAIHSIIVALLYSHPKNLQIILTSRLPLPSGQAKLVAQTQLAIIERSEVEFSPDETSDYIKSVVGLDLNSEQVQLLQERTGGWIAAVGLAIDLLQNNPAQSNELFIRLTGFVGNIYNFFAEEVYITQPSETQWLLKRLGIARWLQPDIVNLFTKRDNGGQVLKDLARHNTFLVEDQEKGGAYRLHTLFIEFLSARFLDEEGSEAIRQAHTMLANHYLSQREWYLTVEHAIDAEEWQIAIQSLEIIGPVGISLGYGQTFLTWIEKIPKEQYNTSSLLCELIGLSALQVGDLDLASQEFDQSKKLYALQQDTGALNRLKYYSAEVNLDKDAITPEDFLRLAYKVASWSNQHNDVLFEVQVELRLIQVGQTIAQNYKNFFRELVKRSEDLVQRLVSLGPKYDLIRAKVLASQAHLVLQIVSLGLQQDTDKVLLREKFGHPIGLDEKASCAKNAIEGFQIVFDLYDEAEKIAKEQSEIEWAIIHASHMVDFAHHLSQVSLIGLIRGLESSSEIPDISDQTKKTLTVILAELERCKQVFYNYHLTYAFVKTVCDATDIYDVLKDVENRDRLAKEAFVLAKEKGFTELILRAEKILQNKGTFTALLDSANNKLRDDNLAILDEDGKSAIVTTMLHAFLGDPDIDTIRSVIKVEVDDMAAVAKQKIEWCRHIEIIQDLRHTQKVETMYRTIPSKWIVCQELRFQSPTSAKSFSELWPMFKGGYCLGCKSRSLSAK